MGITELSKNIESMGIEEAVENAKIGVVGASTPKELAMSVITLASTKELLKQAKTDLKKLNEEPQAILKALDKKAKELENDIKVKVTETFEEKIVVKQYVDEETGEISHKDFTNNNLGKGMFTFSKEKKEIVADFSKITKESHPELFKQVWVLDTAALKDYDLTKLPNKEKVTAARVGIQYASVKAKALKEGK